MSETRPWKWVFVSSVSLLGSSAFLAQPVIAGHSVWSNGATYPSNGMVWMSADKNFSGLLYVEHNGPGCNPQERDRSAEVWANIRNSSIFGRWDEGVRMSNQGCSGTLTSDGTTLVYSSNAMDTGIGWDMNRENFRQSNGSYIGGRIRRQPASPEFCAFQGAGSSCGHRPFVQMNWNKWVGNDGGISGDPYRRRQVLHETGHSHGLIDCPGSGYYGMLMNGSCGWDEGLIGWNDDDRQSVDAIYPPK